MTKLWITPPSDRAGAGFVQREAADVAMGADGVAARVSRVVLAAAAVHGPAVPSAA